MSTVGRDGHIVQNSQFSYPSQGRRCQHGLELAQEKERAMLLQQRGFSVPCGRHVDAEQVILPEAA